VVTATARLWDAKTGQAVGEPMKHEDAVLSAQFSLDSRRIVTASADNTARLWDAPTRRNSFAETAIGFRHLPHFKKIRLRRIRPTFLSAFELPAVGDGKVP
jgi:WD40 repeat protein